MPNDCWNTVRLSGNESTVARLHQAEFSFELFHPPPSILTKTDDLLEWQHQHWGTKWNRYEYKLIQKGNTGLEIKFSTAWSPPYAFFEHILDQFPDVWIRCDWIEEGGMSGIFVGYVDEKNGKVIKEMHWNDWCLEDFYYKFQDSTNTHNHFEVS
jgi:hypothetical protein